VYDYSKFAGSVDRLTRDITVLYNQSRRSSRPQSLVLQRKRPHSHLPPSSPSPAIEDTSRPLKMSNTPNRLSTYSNGSTPLGPRSAAQHSTQLSTTTLLNTLHTIYTSGQPYPLDASTSLVVNTWLTAIEQGNGQQEGLTIDGDIARRAWEHARRRAEDGCVVLTLA